MGKEKHHAPEFTWGQIKAKVEALLKKEGLDDTAPVKFPTNCGGKILEEIYIGGDSEPEVVVIKLRQRTEDEW